VRVRRNGNYSTTHIYRYLLMLKIVQTEDLGRGLFAVICLCCLVVVDSDVGVHFHVVTRPPVSRG